MTGSWMRGDGFDGAHSRQDARASRAACDDRAATADELPPRATDRRRPAPIARFSHRLARPARDRCKWPDPAGTPAIDDGRMAR